MTKEAVESLRRAYALQPLHYYGTLKAETLRVECLPNPLTALENSDRWRLTQTMKVWLQRNSYLKRMSYQNWGG